MSAPKGYTAQDYLEARRRLGSNREVAAEFGVNESTVRRALERIDPAIKASMKAVGTDMVPQLAWAKVPAKDGEPGYSVLLKPQGASEDTLQRIREAFEGMTPAEPVTPPESVMADLCAVYPICDIHANMIAHASHTGGDEYNLGLMRDDMLAASRRVMDCTPDAHTAVLVLNGDTLDTDNAVGMTPGHGHVMHKDGTQFAATMAVIGAVRVVIAMLLRKHKRVVIRVLRGNHDETSHIAVTTGLLGYMAEEDRVTVEAIDNDLFAMQWGRSGIFAHHGDVKIKLPEFALTLSDIVPWWSEVHHRVCFMGHIHNARRSDFGTIMFKHLRPFAPLNGHGAMLKYTQRRALHSVTFCKLDGPKVEAIDPIRRTLDGN